MEEKQFFKIGPKRALQPLGTGPWAWLVQFLAWLAIQPQGGQCLLAPPDSLPPSS